MRYNYRNFPRSIRSFESYKMTMIKNLNFEFLIKKHLCFASTIVTAIIQLKYRVLNFLIYVFQIPYRNEYVLRYALLSILLAQIIPAFIITIFPKFYLYLFVCLINYSFFMNSVFTKPFYPYYFTPKITPLSLMIFIQNFYAYTFSYFLWKGT